MTAPVTKTNMTMMGITAAGAFAGAYSGFLSGLPIPGALMAPVGGMIGAAGGNFVYSMISDLKPTYSSYFMIGLWAAGGAFAASFLGGFVPVNPRLLQSAGAAGGALIGVGVFPKVSALIPF